MAGRSTSGEIAAGDAAYARPAARPFWRLHFQRRITLWGIGFVLPTILFFAVFKFGPMVWAIELSFTSYDMVSMPAFVGLDNYRKLLADPVFRESLVNTLVYIAGSTILITVASLGLALAINTRVPGARYCMMAMFLTNLMPIIAVCLVWRFLLHPFGLITQLLQPFGIDRVDWLTSQSTAMPAIIAVTAWRFAPYFMVVFLAGLLAIPKDYYEAAEIDGAGGLLRFRHVTLPLLLPTIFFVVVISALLSARIFLMPYIMTGGGPGNATRVLSMLIYETGFSYMKMGEAAAISVVLFAIMLVFTMLQMRLFMRGERVHG
ncbi:MAG: sugar ABC transporter permease [Alphaproteobacteria bacterium]|nr:sugar ABC transporter permease [Alphaproteobacteria bacterium]